jgi:hypothetical protein
LRERKESSNADPIFLKDACSVNLDGPEKFVSKVVSEKVTHIPTAVTAL